MIFDCQREGERGRLGESDRLIWIPVVPVASRRSMRKNLRVRIGTWSKWIVDSKNSHLSQSPQSQDNGRRNSPPNARVSRAGNMVFDGQGHVR